MSIDEAAGLSAARLQILDRYIQSHYIESGKIPGALIVVARRGALAHFSAMGMADPSSRLPPSARKTPSR